MVTYICLISTDPRLLPLYLISSVSSLDLGEAASHLSIVDCLVLDIIISKLDWSRFTLQVHKLAS